VTRSVLGWVGVLLAGVGCLQSAAQAPTSPASTSALSQRAVLNRYCVTCHNEKLKTAGLMLDKVDIEKVSEGAPVWEKVVRKLRTSAMPPIGAPRPDQATYDSLATYLETALDRAAAARPNPGRSSSVHRLNRAEYTNAIRDLLALDFAADSLLPSDDSGYGFDNIGDVLSMSPLLLERYMSAAGQISRLAVGSPVTSPDFASYDAPRFLVQEDRMSEDLPFGSRGGIAVRHFFPLNGEYVIKVILQRSAAASNIRGLDRPHRIDLRLDGERVKLFTVGGKKGKPAQAESTEADAGLEVRIPVKAGTRLIGVSFVKESSAEREDLFQPEPGEEAENPAIGSIAIGGPYDVTGPGETASRRRIFVCRPTGTQDDEACAKKIISNLARRAYRGSVADQDLQALLGFYREGKGDESFEAGIERALEAILVSPKFLFRVERDPANVAPGTAYRVSDLELASRLSFFLWSSIPDDQLLDLAQRGKLNDSEVLEQQTRRMLADARAKALVDNFAGQWLYVRNVRSASPDLGEFPDFDDNLRDALQQETVLFFESMLREDRSVLDLLNADYTFLNERLARHYGIPNIYGSHFRRVTLTDENRKGLLGQGSILMVTSFANRTSPTLRGKWLLTNILGAPPPPPPPNVPSLKDRGDDGKILSMRQQMEQHRANPACAVCHARMDPLGFALENFDAIGKWRTTSGSTHTPIDSSGALPDGTKFNGPAELRKVLLSKPEQFVTTVTEKLLTYALGRGIDYYDEPAVRNVMRAAAPSNYRWSSIILNIVRSTPFQMRKTQEPTTAAALR